MFYKFNLISTIYITSKMSEENNTDLNVHEVEKVTTKVKVKSPGRVACARSLAQKKREKKEGKSISEKLNVVNKNVQEDIKIDKNSHQMLQLQNYQIWIGLGAILVAVVALYYQKKSVTPNKFPDQKVNRPTSDCKSITIPTPSVLSME
jgi:uncharacterized membrane protein